MTHKPNLVNWKFLWRFDTRNPENPVPSDWDLCDRKYYCIRFILISLRQLRDEFMSADAASPAQTEKAVQDYDAILLVSFGGPEGMEDVIPFLENVLRGKNVPRERMLEVAHHYEMFDGVSPINQQMRDLLDALRPALKENGVDLPVYWGNRNWTPYLDDEVARMQQDGVKSALALVVSAYSCYSGCRQYRENIQEAQSKMGSASPRIHKLRVFYNHPLFISANVDHVREALQALPAADRDSCHIAFTAHSIPMSMARTSDYEKQLTETCRLVTEKLGIENDRWQLVYQSRSGRPQDPWLEPDIVDHLENLSQQGQKTFVVVPIGFLSDHMEVLFDLDVEAQEFCDEHGLTMSRAKSVGTHPDFIAMLVELIQERLDPNVEKRAIGQFPPNHDFCPQDCCPRPQRPQAARPASSS